MRSMRKIAALLGALYLLAACDGGGSDDGASRAEFDAYEARVNPLLREEERVRNRFDESYKAAVSLGNEEDLEALVRDEILPAYERLDREVETVRPEGGRLRAIHLRLENYLSARVRVFKIYMEWARQAAVPARELTRDMKAVGDSRKIVTEKVTRIDELVRAAQRDGNTALVDRMQKLLKDDPVMAISPGFFQVLSMWMQGQVSDANGFMEGFERALDEKVDPYYAKLESALEEAVAAHAGDEGVLEALEAVKEYRKEMLPCLRTIRSLIRTHKSHDPFIMEVLAPLREQYDGGLAKTDEDLRSYLQAARDYRKGK